MNNLEELIKFLIRSPVDFVLIGGFAAVLHGCNRTTRDIDICILFDQENLQQLEKVLQPINPCVRHTGEKWTATPAGAGFASLHLKTDLGELDIVSRVEGVGGYHDVLKNSLEVEIYSGVCHVISLDDLIASKKILGRHHDLAVVEELEMIREELKNS